MTCSLCGRSGSADSFHCCRTEGCTQPICRTCFDVRGRTLCRQHHRDLPAPASPFGPADAAAGSSGLAPAPASPPAAAGGATGSGTGKAPPAAALPAFLAGAPNAIDWDYLRSIRTLELNVLSRFQQNVELRPAVPTPDGRTTFTVRDFAAARSLSDQTAAVRRLFPASVSVRDLKGNCPWLSRCRYNFADQKLALEMRSCLRLEALLAEAAAAAPLTAETLLEAIDDLAAEGKRAGVQTVAGLFSPTGWDATAKAQIVGSADQPALVHPGVSVCLVGPGVFDLACNPTDRRLALYRAIFAGQTLAEEADRCKARMLEELFAKDRVFIRSALGPAYRPEAVELALKDLLAERKDVDLIDVEEAGPTLKWRK